MGRNFCIVSIMLLFTNCCLAQSIALRFSYGSKTMYSKPIKNNSNNFDPTFNGKDKRKTYDVAYGVELIYPKGSFEFSFGKQDLVFGFRTQYKEVGLGIIDYTSPSFKKIQFNYNRYLNFTTKNKKSVVTPIIGLGFNIGFNSKQKYYSDSFYKVYRIYSDNDPNKYIDTESRDTAVNKIVYSINLKAGLAFKKNNIERARLHIQYSFGLNFVASRNYKYYHTNTFYTGKSYSRGNELSVLLSLPFYIKRKR